MVNQKCWIFQIIKIMVDVKRKTFDKKHFKSSSILSLFSKKISFLEIQIQYHQTENHQFF